MINKAYLRIITLFLFFAVAISFGHTENFKVKDIEIITPWTRATPNSAKVASGYLKIINHSQSPDRLLEIRTDFAENAQIHSMKMENGVMKMRHLVDGLTIPAKSEVILKPGDFHIMFVNISKAIKKGDNISATLSFENAGSLDVVFHAEKLGAKAPSQ